MSESVGGIHYDLSLKTSQLVTGSNTAKKSLSGLEGSFESAGFAANALSQEIAGIFAAGALVAQFKAASDAARAFEVSMSNISALTGATGKDLAFIGESAKDLGLKYGKSATDIVEAMKLIGSTKPELLANKEALKEVTEQVLVLAKAATMGAPEAAASLTAALNQFGAGAESAGEFINIMAAGAQQGTAEVTQVTEALKNAGATANSVGVSFSDTNAAIQGLAKGAIIGSEAGTALKAILLKLETDANTKLRPSINGLSGAINNLAKENYSIAELTKKFGVENVNATLTLIAQKDAVTGLSTSLVGTKAAYDQAKTNSDNFQGSLDKLKASFILMQITIGEKLNPSLRVLADAFTAVLTGKVQQGSALEAVLAGIEVAALSLGAVVASRLIVAMVGYVSSTVAAARAALMATPAVTGLGAALGMQAAAATRATLASNLLTISMTALRNAMAFLGGPLGVAMLAAVAIYEVDKSMKEQKARDYADAIAKVEKSFRSLNAAARANALAEINLQMDELISKQKTLDAKVKDKAGKVGGVLGTSSGEITATAEAVKNAAAIRELTDKKKAMLKVNAELEAQAKKPVTEKPEKPKTAVSAVEDKGLASKQEQAYQELLRLRISAAEGIAKIDMQELDELDKISKLKFKNTADLEEAKSLVQKKYEQERVDFRAKILAEDIEKDKKYREEQADLANEDALNQLKAEQDRADLKASVRGFDPLTSLKDEYDSKMALVLQYETEMAQIGVDVAKEANAAKLAIDQEYTTAKDALMLESWAKQSEVNQFTLDALDAFASASTSAISGLLTGTMTASDAMKNLASSILNEAVGALTQMGLQYVKNMIIQQTADKARQTAGAAAMTASASGQVAMMSSMAAMNAFAATAAIPMVGPALAPAAAAAAGAAAGAIGAPSIVAAPIAGARRYGGAVSAGSMYQVNEGGMPEMFTASNGNQYMMATANGSVTPSGELGGGGGIQININNFAGADIQTSTSSDGKIIEIAVKKSLEAVGASFSSNTGAPWDGLKAGSNTQSKL